MASTLTAPTPITIPFAASGSKNTIPTTSQIGVVDGAASYPDGFPPLCGTPLESGGKPPSRSDMNGILHGITENLRYLLGGCVPKFSSTFAAAIGGYPVGSIVQDNAGANCYRNLVDGNATDFNTTPASIGVSWELVYGPDKTVPSATTSLQGKVELATIAETQAGTDTTRAITPAGLAATVLGMGQAWSNVMGSRALGTTYTNSTGRPILVNVTMLPTTNGQSPFLTINGTLNLVGTGQQTSGQGMSVFGLVPNGATYLAGPSAAATLTAWSELR